MELTDKDISTKYVKLSEIEHVLKRPGRYIGSTSAHKEDIYLLLDGKFQLKRVTYNPGLLKTFDEIISNSVDEHQRNSHLNKIKVVVNRETGEISVLDNGGIPVRMHMEHRQWIPEFIFTNLRTGSNFDDKEQRTGAGTHGEGATLTNIFSKSFRIQTADGKKSYDQTFRNNLRDKTEPIIKTSQDRYTKITFLPDYERFGMTNINDANYYMIRKRVIDIAACNRRLKLWFEDEKFDFVSFKQYCKLYDDEIFYDETRNWRIGVGLSTSGFKVISFANSVETRDGGNHVNYVINQMTNWLRENVKRKYKWDVKPSDLRNHMILFIDATIINPQFSSQTKEKLITEINDFGSSYSVQEKFMKEIFKSEILQRILDWLDRKQQALEKAEARKINRSLSNKKVLKLIDAQKKGNRDECILGIFEGDSALSAVREFRNTQTFGAFPLKGKFMNVSKQKNIRIINNEEIKNIMASIGLRLGETPRHLRYGKIYIYTDADPDGNSIAGLLINFFAKYWPQLYDQHRIYKVMTPLLVYRKGSKTVSFYTNEEFEEWSKKNSYHPDDIDYRKGLAALEDDEYEEIIKNPYAIMIERDPNAKESLDSWYVMDEENLNLRKKKILEA